MLGTFLHPDANIKPSQLENYGLGIWATSLALAKPTIRFVDGNNSTAADRAGYGKDFDLNPWATIAYAVTQAPKNSILMVAPSHTETVSDADYWPFGNSGVTVVGMGQADARPTITFDTATDAQILLDLASTSLFNMKFVAGLDDIVQLFSITAAACQIIGCYIDQEGGLGATEAARVAIGLDNVAADRCRIIGNRIRSTATGANSAIKIATAVDEPEIGFNYVHGDFADACIHNPTANVATLLDIHHNRLTQLQSDDHAIELVSACTGLISYNIVNSSLAALATKTAIDPGACLCIENYGSDATDQSGVINPVYDAA